MENYRPPLALRHHHFATLYPYLFRRVEGVRYQRRRVFTPDDDFLDLDWSYTGGEKLVIALHGLEGSSESQYIKGLVRIFNAHHWDVAAMNFRGCSGELNRNRRTYHSGETGDLDFVINNIVARQTYKEIALVGFSLGGNVVLKYGGEKGPSLSPLIKKIVGISVPLDLESCSHKIEGPGNYLYMKNFLISLKQKFRQRESLYPDLDRDRILRARGFSDFDEYFTAPVHGFSSAKDYWSQSSSRQFLPHITIPTLIINARNDSFLSELAFPFEEVKHYPNLHLLAPRFGGHVGFTQRHPRGYYWAEERALAFVTENGF
jgi:predicted alpha/beta-fold hydrolase